MKSFLSRTSRIACAALVASACWPAAPALAHARQVIVPCDTTALITAINNANTAGTGVLLLSENCVYLLDSAASSGTRGANGLPIIDANLTIIGRSTTIQRITGAPKFRIMEVAQGRTVVLSAVTITGGDAGPNPGGGILNARGLVTLQNSVVTGNTADSGAGIANDTGRVSLTNTIVQENDTGSGGGGGGIYNDGELTAINVTVRQNRANTGGGGVYNELGGVATFVASTIQTNQAEDRGGGLFNGSGGVTRLISTAVTQNTAGNDGGGIYNANYTGSVTLTASPVTANTPNNCAPPNSVAGCTD